MKTFKEKTKQLSVALASMLLALGVSTAEATIEGIVGTSVANTYNMTADWDRVSTADGNSIYFWGYRMNGDEATTGIYAQYPGTTMIVNQGDTVTINLTNMLPENVSIIFPGMEGVTATGTTSATSLTAEAIPGGTASYTFTATHAGTYLYHSGSNMDKQIEMGLLGAIIVRPPIAGQAYNDANADSRYDREYLYLMTEMDLQVHEAVELGQAPVMTGTKYEYWFLNGRTAVDTLFQPGAGWLPNQPYNSLPLMHPGERLLLRVVSAGTDSHPLHPHGNNFDLIARDGRLLQTAPGMGADLSYSDYTLQADPGSTLDMIFQWTGKGMGWDFYGHAPGDPMEPHEDPDSHGISLSASRADGGKELLLPQMQDVTIGGFYSGSPFLGQNGELPPGEGGLNPWDGFFFPWHSHHEKELTNFDIYPGGILTFFSVVPWDYPL